MKLAIYETVHLDWVLPYCEMFLLRSDEVYFLTNISFEKDIRATLGSSFSKFNWEFMDTEMGQIDFYKTLKRFFTLDKYDGIILNSVEARHLFVSMAVRKISSTIFINVHDINNFFRPTWQFTLRPLSRTLGKKLLIEKASGYITNAEAMRDYMVSEQISTRPVFWLPPVIANAGLMQLQPSDIITFTIPGSIDEKRRDYDTVLDALSKIKDSTHLTFKLILAGRPVGNYGSSILNKAKELQQNGIDVFYSEEDIEEPIFQQLIAGSTILISPLRKETIIHENIVEQYGKTKVSGNTYDAIRHGKPMILPSKLVVPKEISTSCLPYSSANQLQLLLQQLLTDKLRTNQMLKTAWHNSQSFSAAATSEKLNDICTAIVNLNGHAGQPKK